MSWWVYEKMSPKWVWTLSLWHHAGVILPVQPAELITHYALLLSACLKPITAVQNFIEGSWKRCSPLFKWFPTNYCGARMPFISPSLCPLCSWCVFLPLPLSKSLILAFLHPLIHSLNTSILVAFRKYAKYLQLLLLLSRQSSTL